MIFIKIFKLKKYFHFVLLHLFFNVNTAPYTLKGSRKIQGFALIRAVLFSSAYYLYIWHSGNIYIRKSTKGANREKLERKNCRPVVFCQTFVNLANAITRFYIAISAILSFHFDFLNIFLFCRKILSRINGFGLCHLIFF